MTESTLNLALQGGGAHGAFTWGVLDRLLEEPGITIDRISGTSAGAMNGAALATGYARNGPEGARENLARLWQRVAEAGIWMTMLHVPLRKPGPGGVWDDATPLMSPYHTNPLSIEPLRYILAGVVDLDLLRSERAPTLFVNAVNVRTGALRVFDPAHLSLEALMAAAAAPLSYQAVYVDDEPYWDGTYVANPPLHPLHENRNEADILLVELMPWIRDDLPTTAKNILSRINEISTLHALSSELQELARQRASGQRDIRVHRISLPQAADPGDIEPSTKRTVDMLLFLKLKRIGIAACERWLAAHRQDIGLRSSMADDHERYPMATAGAD
jgi:NTE family protein